jgi:peptide/nickel transport system substrate-binding protein
MVSERTSRRSVTVLGAALLLVLAVACGGEGSRRGVEPVAGPVTVRALLSHDPPSLSLIGKADRNSAILAVQLTDSLLQFDPDLTLQPRLAESYEFSEDRRSVTFRLRSAVRWHDGREVTAEDVVFSVEQARDPAVENTTFGALFADLVSVEALDARTVRATYSLPVQESLEGWRLPIIPRHLAQRGGELLTGEFSRHPVGCGPFRFVRYRPGEEIVLEANDDYWDGRPRIDRLVFRIFPDQRTGFQALLAGELDLMNVTPDLWHEARESAAGSRLESTVYYRLVVWQVAWNQDGSNPFFTDPRVRRAMLHALDREKFNDNVVHGLARPGVTTYHPDLKRWTDPSLEPLRYDPDVARRLLEEAGWIDRDGDGVREREGQPFRFTQALNDDMAAWQQQSWREVGVDAAIEKLEWNQFRERRGHHEFEAAMSGMSFTASPDQFELYHSSARDGGFNFVGLDDPEVDRLLEQGQEILDEDRRRVVFHRLQHRLNELQPLACLFHFPTPVLHDRRLQGLVPSPFDHWRTTEGPRLWRWVADSPDG